MERLILEYTLLRLKDKDLTDEERVKLVLAASIVMDLYLAENL